MSFLALTLVTLVTLQALEPSTFLPEVGHELVITARTNDPADPGRKLPIAGLAIRMTRDGVDAGDLGSTGADGTLRVTPSVAGRCELRASLKRPVPGQPPVELVTPIEVVPAPDRRRWLWISVPAALVLLVHALRRCRSEGQAATRGPC